MRFTVHRPGNPVASPRSHGVPRRDVDGRIHISVAGVSAGGAPEDGLALARLRIHLPARRAPLARERGINLLHPAGRLLLQAAHEQAPPRPKNLPVQACLLADVPARVTQCSPRSPGHLADLEVLDPYQVETPSDVRSCLLGPILAPVGVAGAQPCEGQAYSSAAVRAAPRPGQRVLQLPHALAFSRGKTGDTQQVPGGQRCGHRHAPVNSNDLTGTRCRDRHGNRREGNMPSAGPIQRHPIGLHVRRHVPRPAKPYPSCLRHPDFAGFPTESPQVPLLPTAHDAEALVPSGPAPCRPPSWILRIEEGGQSTSEVSQCLLLHRVRARSQPVMLAPGLGELSTLLRKARGALSARAPVRMLLDGQVPDVPGVRAMSAQYCFLSESRKQSISRHANRISMDSDIF